MHDSTPTAGLDRQETLAVLIAATRAPSLHNSQPWVLRLRDGAVDVLADPARRLLVADPRGREQRVSCGAALHNVRVALLALGHRPVVTVLPDPSDPTLIGTVRPGGPRPATAAEQDRFAAIGDRHTQRDEFGSQPVSADTVRAVRGAALRGGVGLEVVTDPRAVERIAVLARRAHRVRMEDPAFRSEVARWTAWDGPRDDGVPAELGGPVLSPSSVWTPSGSAGPPGSAPRSASPLPAFLTTHTDGPREEVRAGAALQAVLLTATTHGVGVAFLTDLIEVEPMRTSVRRLLGLRRPPQIALRLGPATAGPRTPRRAPESVLAPDSDPLPD
ncbi:Acg family FMN-binding oxidoreductase [Pseudonocardia alni]|uniref:Acg family FMN-binding oxidoreductase n=1 Tax=Pseudonocardia alni TaxID=33907 RepID=UPI00331AA341